MEQFLPTEHNKTVKVSCSARFSIFVFHQIPENVSRSTKIHRVAVKSRCGVKLISRTRWSVMECSTHRRSLSQQAEEVRAVISPGS